VLRHLSRLQGVGKIVARLLQFKAAALGLRRHAASAIQQAFEFARIDSQNDEACSQGVEPAELYALAGVNATGERPLVVAPPRAAPGDARTIRIEELDVRVEAPASDAGQGVADRRGSQVIAGQLEPEI